MNVLFLEIDTDRAWSVASVGPAFLAAHLRNHGHTAAMIRVAPDAAIAEILKQVQAHEPGVLALSLTTRQWLRARDVVRGLRAELDVPVVAGGLHPTFSPEVVLASAGFDHVCLGEGEEAFLELVEALAAHAPVAAIKNIWTRGMGRPALRLPMDPLDSVPFMARDFLDEHLGVVHMSTQRGCPFPCTYCAARQYQDLYNEVASYGRRRSCENVIAELQAHARDSVLNYIIFLDDTFTVYPRWVKRYCEIHEAELGTPFSLHARVETVSPDMLQRLARAGCRHIVYGVESGSERVRREILHRPVTNQRIIDTFAMTRDAGIMVTANYMLGIPGETRADMEQTLEIHHQLDPYDFGYFVFYPYMGTQLFHVCEQAGYLPANYLELPALHRQSILNLPGLTQADIGEFYDRWTEVRAAQAIARSGGATPAVRQQIREDIIHCAATG